MVPGVQVTLASLLLQGFPSLLLARLGRSLAVHPWSGNLHHQGDLVDLSLQESPSGLVPQVHPDTHRQREFKKKTESRFIKYCVTFSEGEGRAFTSAAPSL